MKKIVYILFINVISAVSFTSCSNEESEEIEESVETSITVTNDTCDSPSDLKIRINEDGDGDFLLLEWSAGNDELEWEVTYTDSTGESNTYTTNETSYEISSFTQDSSISVKAICEENNESEEVEFEKIAQMTADIDGVSYLNLQPRNFSMFNSVTQIYFVDGEANRLILKGSNSDNDELNDFNIDFYINSNNFEEGVYDLESIDNESIDINSDTFVDFYNPIDDEGVYFTKVEETGSLNITTFDLEERIIEATFSFSYNVYSVSTGDLISTNEVENGTFKYSLDAEYFY